MISFYNLAILLLAFSSLLDPVVSHADFMTSSYCSTPLTPGTVIMGRSAVSSTGRSVIVKRGSTVLTSGASYVYGETLTVSLSSTSGEYNLQTSGATFSGGGCSSTRLANTQGSLVVPTSGSTTVSVLGAWAASKSTVSISSTFNLAPPVTTAVPTIAPSISLRPSTIAPTHPTYTPTTATPTISFAPSTLSPTALPSAQPTLAPTDTPSSKSAAISSGTVKAVVGIVVGAVGGLGLLLSAYAYSARVVSGTLDRKVVNLLIVRIVAAVACLLSIVMIILLSQWSTDVAADATDTLYLGTPSWSTTRGYFSYHPTLMTSGFLGAQVFAAATWSLGTVRENAKLAHVLFQTAGLACALTGYVAILEYQSRMNSATLASMHSIVGVCAVAVFGLNYLWGAVMALLTMYHPTCIVRRAIDLRAHHKKFGIFAMILSLVAVISGVMNVLPMGVCYANPASYSLDPSGQYEGMFTSCKLGFGVGICAMLAVLGVLWAVADRGESFASSAVAVATNNNANSPKIVTATAVVENSNGPPPNINLVVNAGMSLDGIELGQSSTSSANHNNHSKKNQKTQYTQLAVQPPK